MSILNVNKINPVGGGSTITIAGIASVTNNISVGNSVTAGSFVGPIEGAVTGNVTGNVTGDATGLSGNPSINTTGIVTATSFVPTVGQLSHRNLIINGAAQVNQRGTQTSVTSTTYSVDRFRFAISAGGTFSLSQVTDSPDGFANSVKIDCTTANSSAALVLIQQRIEGQNLQAFAKGTSSAKQFAVSFYVKTNKSGIYTVELKDDDNSRTVSKTITVSDANWNRYTLIFPADTTGAFDNDTNGSLYLSIWLAASSTYTNGTFSSGSWAALVNGNRISSSNVNLADSTSNEFLLTGVQLEVGPVVTPFEHRTYQDEFLRCSRYFYFANSQHFFIGRGNNSDSVVTFLETQVPLRSTPSVTLTGSLRHYGIDSNSSSTATPTVPSFRANQKGIRLNQSGHSGVNDDCVLTMQCSGSDGQGIFLDAEI